MKLKDFYEQETKKFTGIIKVNEVAQDISLDTVTFYLMAEPKTEPVVEIDADVTLGEGQYEVELSKEQTKITPREYYYEIWWYLNNGERKHLESGSVKVIDSKYYS